MALSKEEREQFLAEPHIAALSVSAGDKRGPLTVPIWYQYSPGGEPWVITGTGSRKHRLIETQGEFTLMAHRTGDGALCLRRRSGEPHRGRHRRAPRRDDQALPRTGKGRRLSRIRAARALPD